MTEITTAGTSSAHEMIAFCAGAQEFCLPVTSIREIKSWTQVTPIPQSPRFVLGVVNLRGTVLPVIDLAVRIGYEPTKPTPRHAIIVTESSGGIAGLLVDAVSDIITIRKDQVQPIPDVASELAKSFVSGVISLESRMIGVIELEGVLPAKGVMAA
jgi:purine-binding chemotaxis protein CheW